MSVTIVRITPSTAGLLRSVAPDLFDGEIEPARVAALVEDANALLFVVWTGERVIGQVLAHIQRHPDLPTELFINDLAVAQAHQRQGWGRALLEAVWDEGERRGCEDFWVAADPENAPAQALYSSLGLSRRLAVLYEAE